MTAFALDQIPRTLSKSQACDVLSSMANIAGYRAVVEASHTFGRMFAPQACLLAACGSHFNLQWISSDILSFCADDRSWQSSARKGTFWRN